jgi:Mor family transcriptional regulator
MNKWDKHYLSDEQKAKMIADRSKGLSVEDLVTKYRSSKGMVYRVLKDSTTNPRAGRE